MSADQYYLRNIDFETRGATIITNISLLSNRVIYGRIAIFCSAKKITKNDATQIKKECQPSLPLFSSFMTA